MSSSDIGKLRGAKPLVVFTAIFSLPFVGVNFFRGIVNNPGLSFQKDVAYEFLKNPRYNWRKFLLSLVTVVVWFMATLTSGRREKVLIIDDSTYDRFRSKAVESLAWIHDHNTGQSLKGFKLLTLGWSDGVSFLPLDFVLCSSAKASKRLQRIKKDVDKRCCGHKRRQSITIRMDETLKKQAETLFEEMGMNMTTAFTVFAKAVVRQGKIPFEVAADPFFCTVNQARLREAIHGLEAGHGVVRKTLAELEAMENA